jgi:DUF1365 family protein
MSFNNGAVTQNPMANSPHPTELGGQVLIGFGHVVHHRLRPSVHQFKYPNYFVLLPVRALAKQVHTPTTLAINRPGLLSFYHQDHGLGEVNALTWIEDVLKENGINDADGEVWLQTYPRVLGFVFKPVSFWYCFDKENKLKAVIAEVNNTFGERHCYLLDPVNWDQIVEAKKVFHVSPFCDVAGHYEFKFQLKNTPDKQSSNAEQKSFNYLSATVNHHDENGLLIHTRIEGKLQTYNQKTMWHALLSYGLMTLAVWLRIHWQAFGLWRKKVGFRSKPQKPAEFLTK